MESSLLLEWHASFSFTFENLFVGNLDDEKL